MDLYFPLDARGEAMVGQAPHHHGRFARLKQRTLDAHGNPAGACAFLLLRQGAVGLDEGDGIMDRPCAAAAIADRGDETDRAGVAGRCSASFHRHAQVFVSVGGSELAQTTPAGDGMPWGR